SHAWPVFGGQRRHLFAFEAWAGGHEIIKSTDVTVSGCHRFHEIIKSTDVTVSTVSRRMSPFPPFDGCHRFRRMSPFPPFLTSYRLIKDISSLAFLPT